MGDAYNEDLGRRWGMDPQSWVFSKKNVEAILADLPKYGARGFREGSSPGSLAYKDGRGQFPERPVVPRHEVNQWLQRFTRHANMARDKLWSSARAVAFGISKRAVARFLANSERRQVHAPTPPRRLVAPSVVYRAGSVQADLIEKLSPQVRYCCTLVEMYSHMILGALFLNDKESATVAAAVGRHLDTVGAPIQLIRCDNGGEFRGAFEDMCTERGIRIVRGSPYSSNSQGMVERANSTVRRLAGQYNTATGSYKGLSEAMPRLLAQYNQAQHPALPSGVSPSRAFFSGFSDEQLRQYLVERQKLRASKLIRDAEKNLQELQVGDRVRISLTVFGEVRSRKLTRKASQERHWTVPLYTVTHVMGGKPEAGSETVYRARTYRVDGLPVKLFRHELQGPIAEDELRRDVDERVRLEAAEASGRRAGEAQPSPVAEERLANQPPKAPAAASAPAGTADETGDKNPDPETESVQRWVGTPVARKFKEDGKWYRGVIQAVLAPQSPDEPDQDTYWRIVYADGDVEDQTDLEVVQSMVRAAAKGKGVAATRSSGRS
jgi:transposase InsO family protein